MKVAVLTEGEGEVPALPHLFPQVMTTTRQMMRPSFVSIPPLATPPLIARSAMPRIKQLFARGADRVIVIIDKETHPGPASLRAGAIQKAIEAGCNGDVRVVVKDSCIENWLIADPQSFSLQPGLFAKPQAVTYPAGKADRQAGEKMIKRALDPKHSYDKRKHPEKIFSRSTVETMTGNSESFQEFLRAIRA